MESQFQPNLNRTHIEKTPSASAAWSINFNLKPQKSLLLVDLLHTHHLEPEPQLLATNITETWGHSALELL
jgi:hypothetical protein